MSNNLPSTELAHAGNTMQTYVFDTAQTFEAAQRMATALSKSSLVPKEYNEKMPNCLIALEIAQRIGASPIMVMQNLYIVHNKPSWSSQFIISAVNSCGRFNPLRFDKKGKEDSDDRTCIAWTTEKGTEIPNTVLKLVADRRAKGDAFDLLDGCKSMGVPVLESPPVSIAIAKKEQWFQKSGSKWQTMPELMLCYRAATFFGRLYAPEILMGMKTQDEVVDIGRDDYQDVTPKDNSVLDNINAQIEEAKKEKVQEAQPEPKSAGDAGAPAENAEKEPPFIGTIEIPLDAMKRPMWTPYKNDLVKAITALTTEEQLMAFQQANLAGGDQLRQHAETIFQEYVDAASKKYQGLQQAAA